MSTQTKTEAHSIVWFDIPADDVERAKSFYSALFGWKIKKSRGRWITGISTPVARTIHRTAGC